MLVWLRASSISALTAVIAERGVLQVLRAELRGDDDVVARQVGISGCSGCAGVLRGSRSGRRVATASAAKLITGRLATQKRLAGIAPLLISPECRWAAGHRSKDERRGAPSDFVGSAY